MKPRLIAKRNAELRRRERPDDGGPVESSLIHDIHGGRNARARELALAVSQTAGGILVILVGVALIAPVLWSVLSLVLAMRNATVFAMMRTPAMWFFVVYGFVLLCVAGLGIAFIRGGIAMLRSGSFQKNEAPILRALQRLSYDAVPVTGYIVGVNRVTHHVVFTFEHHADERRFMIELATKLSQPNALNDLLGDDGYVPDRRVRLPRELTAGRTIYLADLQVTHSGGKGVKPRLAVPCMVEPGSGGRIAAGA